MMAEGNTGGCGNASIHWTLRGQRPPHVWKLHVRDPGGSANARHEVVSGTVGEGDEPQVQHERWRRVARSCTTCEVPEQRRKTVGGGCGGKTTDQGEHGADDRVPDSMLGQRVERAEPCAGGSKKGQAVTIHCATTPCFRSFTSGQFLCVETRSCSRSGWNDMEGLRDGPGQAAGGLTQPRASGHVSSATFQESLHTQGGWTTAATGHCCPLEDKIVQHAVGTVLNQIYEEDFKGFSYGFRPGRRQHDALDALWVGIMRKKVNWVLDADVRDFFGSISHEWMVKFLQHRIADRRILRLIKKWLRAGVSEDGEWSKTEVGTPQGAVISPLLGNVYLHYVFDLWVQHWRKHRATGEVIVVRYADDSVLGFQYRADAERFLQEWKERLQKFGLQLHPDKTRLIEFGRFAAVSRKKHGEGKPETFNFLGFTHICGQARKNGKFLVLRESIRKRLLAKLKQVKDELRMRMHQPLAEVGKWLRRVIQGYFNYHAVPGNFASLERFRREVSKRCLRILQRRSQKSRMTWKHMTGFAEQWLPRPQILHPYPYLRFDAKYLR